MERAHFRRHIVGLGHVDAVGIGHFRLAGVTAQRFHRDHGGGVGAVAGQLHQRGEGGADASAASVVAIADPLRREKKT